jgi:hypothetical protein
VLGDANLQLGCDSSVEALAFAGQDVGVASFFHAGSLWLWEEMANTKASANTEILATPE